MRGPAAIDFPFIDAAAEGAPGGTADDTDALLAVIDGAPDWSQVVLGTAIYTLQPDAIHVTGQGITLVGSPNRPRALLSITYPKPSFKFLTGGGFGVKLGTIGDVQSNGTGRKWGLGLLGIQMSGENHTFTDALVVAEGLKDLSINRCSMTYTAGRALRMRTIDEPELCDNFLYQIINEGGAAIYIDDIYLSQSLLNVNNILISRLHAELCDADLIYSTDNSNVDEISIEGWSKFEIGYSNSRGANWCINLQANRAHIVGNHFTNYKANRGWAGMIRHRGGSGWSVQNNSLQNCDVTWYQADAAAITADVRNNHVLDTTIEVPVVNNSEYQIRLEKPYSRALNAVNGAGFTKASVNATLGSGWTSVHMLAYTNSAKFVPDTACLNTEGSVLRDTTTSQATVLAVLPFSKLRDFPRDLTLYVRCRRTADGATASLQLNCNGSTLPLSDLDSLPAALTGVALSGDGTTVTATKTAHGYKSGYRVIIAAANEAGFNSAAGVPWQIIVTSSSTFTYLASGSGSATGSITAQNCQWQTAQLNLSALTNLLALGEDSTDRCRLEYGASNSQAIDIDALSWEVKDQPDTEQSMIVNRMFQVWQRGISWVSPANHTYLADCWRYENDTGTGTHTITQSTDVPTFAESGIKFRYSLKLQVTTIDATISGGDYYAVTHRVEGRLWYPTYNYAWTLVFWVKSTKTGTFSVAFRNSGTNLALALDYTINTTDTWEQKILSVPVNAIGGTWDFDSGIGLEIIFNIASALLLASAGSWLASNKNTSPNQVNGMDSTANQFLLAMVEPRLSTTSAPTPIVPFEEELARCRRYCQKSFPYATAPAQAVASAAGALTYRVRTAGVAADGASLQFNPPLRPGTPTMTYYNTANAASTWQNTTDPGQSGASGSLNASEAGVFVTNAQAAGDGAGENLAIHWLAESAVA